jgi:hypothetical protein
VRSKTAIVLALLGLVLLVLGIGQRTWWQPPATVTASVPAGTQGAPVTVVDAAVRSAHDGELKVTVNGDGPVLLAVGRKGDVDAWVGSAAHLTVTGADQDFRTLTTSSVPGEASVPNPSGSDLWVSEQTGTGTLDYTWTAPADGDWSLLLASDGTAAAPTNISITAPNDNSTPWAVPLIVLGILALLAGLVLFLLARRRGEGDGPRSSGSSTDGTNGTNGTGGALPANPATRAARSTGSTAVGAGEDTPKAAPGSTEPGKATFSKRARVGAPAGALMATAALLVGIAPAGHAVTAPATDDAGSVSSEPAATPSDAPASAAATATATAEQAAGQPVLLEAQFSRILDAVANAVSTADAAKDAAQLQDRVAGAALDVRSANYRIRSQVADYAAVVPVTSSRLLTRVIPSDAAWPRTTMAVTQGDENPVPQLLTLVQVSPRDNYKLVGASPLLPGQTFPTMDASGPAPIPADDASDLQYSPAEALGGLGDVLNSTSSTWRDRLAPSPYIADVDSYQQDIVSASPDGSFGFTHISDPARIHALRTADGGAIVVGQLTFTVDGTPKAEGAKLNVADDAAVFTGGKETSTGLNLTFTEPVVLYVPAAGSTGQLTLLSATRGLTGGSFK